jgi:CubicO group peptidase (beta-lactamase class C family)
MKKNKKRTLLIIVTAFLLLNTYMLIAGGIYVYRAIWYFTADIDDYKIFTNSTVDTGNGEPIPEAASYSNNSPADPLRASLNKYKTIAFVVIKNDSVREESYYDGYSDSSYSGSFSVAKSFISALTGIALKEGKIKSLDDKVSQYLPWFTGGMKDKVTIRHLLMMCSGTDWYEAYIDPFSITAEAYYGTDLPKSMHKLGMKTEPGTLFYYKSGDTQLLGEVLIAATGMPLSQYASEKLWKPVHAMRPALWSTDHDKGEEKAFCCFNTNARDFARLGLLYLHNGNWKGTQIIDSDYIAQSTTAHGMPDKSGMNVDYYGYQWWIIPGRGQKIFYARGILGQYILVLPEKNTVIVRLGEKPGERTEPHTFDLVNEMVDYALSLPD